MLKKYFFKILFLIIAIILFLHSFAILNFFRGDAPFLYSISGIQQSTQILIIIVLAGLFSLLIIFIGWLVKIPVLHTLGHEISKNTLDILNTAASFAVSMVIGLFINSFFISINLTQPNNSLFTIAAVFFLIWALFPNHDYIKLKKIQSK